MEHKERKFSAENSDRLLRKERYENLPPGELLAAIGLKPGMVVADVGCGNGYFTLPAAELVGPKGAVYACDISEAMLQKLIERNPPPNVMVRQSGEYRLPLETMSVDMVIASFLLHEVEDLNRFLLEIRRVLKDDGRLWVLEWMKQEEDEGPPEHHRIHIDEMILRLRQNGFAITKRKIIRGSFYSILASKEIIRCSC